jgi:hypothetical protein
MGKKKSDRAVKALTTKLEKAEAKAERWKARAKRLRGEVDESAKQAWKLRKRLAAAESSPGPASAAPGAPDSPGAPAAADTPAAPGAPDVPDGSWTVARLRTEARDRGITGYSRKPKDELVRLLGR